MLNWLKGYGTYIACVGGILTTIAAWLNGSMALNEAILAIIAFVAGVRIRMALPK